MGGWFNLFSDMSNQDDEENGSQNFSFDPGMYSNGDNSQGNTPSSNYRGMYQSYGGEVPEGVSPNDFQFLDPNDPDIAKLRAVGARKGGSDTLKNYLSQMPDRTDSEYQPGIGRKIAAFLLGTLSGPQNAANVVNKVEYGKYNRDLADWQQQGKQVQAQANLDQKSKQDEMNAIKLGLTQKAQAARSAALNKNRQDSLAARLASADTRDQARTQQLSDAHSRLDLMNQRLELSKQQLELAREKYANAPDKPGQTDLPKMNPASARRLAQQEVGQQYDEFFDESGQIKPGTDPGIVAKLKRAVDSLALLHSQGKKPIMSLDEEE